MGVISIAIKHMVAAGCSNSQILELVQELEAEIDVVKPRQTPTSESQPESVKEKIQEDQLVRSDSEDIYINTRGDRIGGTGERKEGRKKTTSTDLEFNRLWQVCPRRVGKGAAHKAWLKAVTKAAPEVIIAGMERYAAKCKATEEQFIAHPATWLNQERWLDEGKSNVHKHVFGGPKRTWAEIKAERGKNALVCGNGQSQEGRISSEEPEIPRIFNVLPSLHRVDNTQENQAALSAQAVSDEVPFCGDSWDEPPPFDL